MCAQIKIKTKINCDWLKDQDLRTLFLFMINNKPVAPTILDFDQD